MAAPGWKLGTHCMLEARHAEGRAERLPALAQELAAKRPSVVVAQPSSSVRAMMAAAKTMPFVLSNGDPLASGLVANLARLGGLITGVPPEDHRFCDGATLVRATRLIE